jgi:hypothetical protein
VLSGAEVLNAPMRFTSIETPSGDYLNVCPLLFETSQAQSGLSTLSTLSTELPKGINSQNDFCTQAEQLNAEEAPDCVRRLSGGSQLGGSS